jgi:hypothetical protein
VTTIALTYLGLDPLGQLALIQPLKNRKRLNYYSRLHDAHDTQLYHSAVPTMGPKKGGKGGQPRRYTTTEEARAAKQAQDRQQRQQRQRQQHARANDPNDDGEIQVVTTGTPASMPISSRCLAD